MTDLVLVGGGHAHALVLRRWGMDARKDIRLTLIDPNPVAPYTGMLPGHVAGHYPRAALEIDLVKLARFAGARFICGRVSGIDPENRRMTVEGRVDVAFDVASVDVGITSAMPDVPGFMEHAVAAKPLGAFASSWATYLQAAKDGGPADVAIIGGGVGGVELALAMEFALRNSGRQDRCVTLIDHDEILRDVGGAVRTRLQAALEAAQIVVLAQAEVKQVTAEGVVVAGTGLVPARLVCGAAGARPYPWLAQTGLRVESGYLCVDETLRTFSDDRIFAVGDCAHMGFAPRPKAGVFAVRQAPVLLDNLRAVIDGQALRRFRPQNDYLKLISLGRKSAIATRNGLMWQGAGMWRWKDRIDQTFMRNLQDLPAMAHEDPLCGGCGAKIGAAALQSGIGERATPVRPDVLRDPMEDAAVLQMGDVRQVLSTDHLRAVTDDPYMHAKIAAVHALGDIWAMGASPQAALSSVTLPPMAARMQAETMREITTASEEVFAAVGADLAGGHSAQGAEMSIGFTLTGLCEGEPVGLAGAQAGDALILTKPIGSGTLLAAEMAGQARGRWITDLFETMTRLQVETATALQSAHAMTDVTGFGLFGHLMNMMEASGTAADVNLDTVPFYDGAVEMAHRGVRSSIFPDNLARAQGLALPDDRRVPLLFDPQTCGGLLAAVPVGEIPRLQSRLGASLMMIGRVRAGAPSVRVVVGS